MRIRDAKKLHNEDEVIVKSTGQVLRVIETSWNDSISPSEIRLFLDDGYWYNHKEIK